jgi:hypothetical protein
MGKKVPFWQFFRKADMELLNLGLKIKPYIRIEFSEKKSPEKQRNCL